MRTCAAAIVVLLLAASAPAATLVVNPASKTADDGNTEATPDKPLRTISAAAALAKAGDTVLVHTGVYREGVVIRASGTAERPIRFAAATGASVVVTGADRLTAWRKESGDGANVFSHDWPHAFITWNRNRAHPDDARHLLIGRAEQVFVNGYALRQVLAKEELARGTFWVDAADKRLWVWADDDADLGKASTKVEASVRGTPWDVRGDYVQTKGITVRYAANMAQRGAAAFAGRGDVVEDCTFEFANSAGAVFTGSDVTVRRCTFRDNGQLGFGAGGAHRLTLIGCTVRGNNTKDFSRGWEAGGCKICLSRGVVIERCTFAENRGTGVWFDIGNEDATVRNCLIERNEDGGIFYEISYGLHAHDNVIAGNGLADSSGAWAVGAGICLSSSPGCVVERNLLVGNKEGFSFREQRRTTRTVDDKAERAVWNHDSVIRNNVLAYNRDAQLAGWFDVKDQRHWPAAMRQKEAAGSAKDGAPGEDVAKEYLAKSATGQPTDLSLEKLNLRLTSNVYAAYPGQSLVTWGPTWARNRRYTSLDEVRGELNLEQESVTAEVTFADTAARDYRLPEDTVGVRAEAMPRGPVPGVQLPTVNASPGAR
jgi:hypothetical protein